MTAVYCTSACGSLVAALDTVVVTSVPDEFEELVRDCSSGVVVCPDPDQDRAFFRWLRRLVRRPSTPPIVAVAPFAPRFISALAPIAIADIVRPADVPTDLRNRLAELARPDPWAALDDLARRAATALPWLPAHLIDLLCDVRRPPITRVGGIQALLGVSHSTIRRVWNTYFPGAGPPKRLVDWVSGAEPRGAPAIILAARALHSDKRRNNKAVFEWPKTASVSLGLAVIVMCTTRVSEAQVAERSLTDRSTNLPVRVMRYAVLGDEQDATVGPNFVFDVAPDGSFMIATHSRPGQLLVFDAQGSLRRVVGRRGQGPGEYSYIRHIETGDTLVHIFDTRNARWTRIRPGSWNVVDTRPFPGDPRDVLVMGDTLTVMNAIIGTPQAIGMPLHEVSVAGRLDRSLGAKRDAPFRADLGVLTQRVLAHAGEDIWAAHVSRYRIERWSVDGRLLDVLERNVPWFESHADPLLPQPDRPPAPIIADIHADSTTGLLWVAINVPDPEWQEGISKSPYEEGSGYQVASWDDYYDTVIEVLDPKEAQVIASTRIDECIWSFGGRTYAASHFEVDGVYPRIAIWLLSVDLQK